MHDVEIMEISKYNYPASWSGRFGVHSHNFFQMFVVLSGTGIITIGNEEHSVLKDSRILIPPDTYHSFVNVVKGNLCLIDVKFNVCDGNLRDECAELPVCDEISGELISLAELARSSWNVAGIHSKSISELLLESVMRSFLDCRMDVCPEWLSLPPVETSGIAKTVADYVELNYVRDFTLGELARDLRYYKTYLCTAFKKETGLSIMAYLNRVRIRHAVDFVCFSNLTLSSISELVGFKNSSHFSSVFKRETNRAPSELRALVLQGTHSDLAGQKLFLRQHQDQFIQMEKYGL